MFFMSLHATDGITNADFDCQNNFSLNEKSQVCFDIFHSVAIVNQPNILHTKLLSKLDIKCSNATLFGSDCKYLM